MSNSTEYILFFFFFIFFDLCDLSPWLGIEPRPSGVKTQNPLDCQGIPRAETSMMGNGLRQEVKRGKNCMGRGRMYTCGHFKGYSAASTWDVTTTAATTLFVVVHFTHTQKCRPLFLKSSSFWKALCCFCLWEESRSIHGRQNFKMISKIFAPCCCSCNQVSYYISKRRLSRWT